MKPHPRIRKTIKWGGLILTACLLVTSLITPWYSFGYRSSTGIVAAMGKGRAWLFYFDEPHEVDGIPGFIFESHGFEVEVPFRARSDRGSYALAVPLWFCLLVVALPTVLAWRLDTLARRRAKVRECLSCRYDRSRLPASSLCPECGHAAQSPQPPAN